MKKPWTIVQGFFQNFGAFLKWPYLEKLKSESAQTCYTAYLHQYVSENVIKFFCDFGEKTMDYSTGIFSKFWCFLKMAITLKIEVGISSNLLHSISTSICIRKCNKNF